MKRIVLAIGGNAIKNEEEMKIVCNQAAILAEKGNELFITHGNGPQVGELLLLHELSGRYEPLHSLVAMTQAQIGYKIQNFLFNFLRGEICANVIITRVMVSKEDPSFKDPKKPIGPIYSEKEAISLMQRGYVIKKVTSGNKIGYRRVVPSPKPIKIIEIETIKKLIEEGIVISCGGGGIPVIFENGKIEGVDAVIDKDLTSALLANEVKADYLIIATDIDRVKLNFMKENEKDIETMNVKEAIKYLKEGQFLEGSMEPKIKACIDFLENGGRVAIITSTRNILKALEGNAGTRITKV